MQPQPPILFVRRNRAFWVEPTWSGLVAATLRAFNGGCFHDTWCYDGRSGRWEIVRASLVRSPRLLDKRLAWRRVLVALELGPRSEVHTGEVVEELCRILGDPGYEHVSGPSPEDLQSRLRRAQSAPEVIEIVRLHQSQ